MQIIELERDDWNFFCPATGRPVFTEDGEPNTPALRGSWCHEVPEEPMHLAEELKPLWQAHMETQEAADDGADVVRYLQSVERPNWLAFEITTCGMACGPVWSTAWNVLDLGCVMEYELSPKVLSFHKSDHGKPVTCGKNLNAPETDQFM